MRKKAAAREGNDHTIKLSVDKAGNLTVDPTTLFADKHDRMSWECEDGGFLVSFKDFTPFDTVNIHRQSSGATPLRHFRRTVTPGTYHYAVAVGEVVDEGKGRVALTMTAGCPEIIVGTSR